MLTRITNRLYLARDTAVSEARGDEYTVKARKRLSAIRRRQRIGSNSLNVHLHRIGSGGVGKRLVNRFVSIVQRHVLPHKGDTHRCPRMVKTLDKVVPRFHTGFVPLWQLKLFEHRTVEPLGLHHQRYFVDRGHVYRLNHILGLHIAKERYLRTQLLGKVILGTKDEDVGLYPILQELLHRVLRRLSLKLARGCQKGHKRKVNKDRIVRPQVPFQLPYGLNIGQRLNIADRPPDFRNYHVVEPLKSKREDTTLDLVSNMRDHLHRLTEVVATALLVDHVLVDLPRRDAIGTRGGEVQETLVVPKIEVGLCAVVSDETLAVFVRVERPRVYIDIRVELLNRNPITPTLQ